MTDFDPLDAPLPPSETTAPALGEWPWEIEQCRGSLDCWTAYAGRKIGPAEHWQGHLRRYPITRRTPKRVYYNATPGIRPGREQFADRADLEILGRAGRGRHRWSGPLYAAEPPMPDGWDGRHIHDQLKALKAAAATVHPDRGGDPAEFRQAWARYERARDRAAS